MKDSDDKHLEEYLAGTDEVSASYRSLSDEKPSAALDESILKAAHEAVADKKASKKTIPVQAYSIAASICVAVLVVSLFLNNEPELMRNEMDSMSIPLSDMPLPESLSADEVNEAIQAALPANTLSIDTDAGAIAVEESLSGSLQIEAESLESVESFEAADAAVFSTQAEEIAEAERLRTEQSAAQEVISAARTLQAEFSYRQNSASWLVEIQRLTEAGDEQALAEERRLFAQTYPDIDIDSALATMQE
jgi:hypothetical protein